MLRSPLTLLSLLGLAACQASPSSTPAGGESFRLPEQYVCYRAGAALAIDGRLDEADWKAAPWTAEFVDIQGEQLPRPRFRTRAKMLWDDEYFYVGAELEEPHLWATLTERDSVIYYDHDFEVFIDPDGDTHEYYELEINALGTEWDLFLVKPYRDGGPALHCWDIAGLKSAVALDGTLNDPSDVDRGWSVEIAIPWAVLAEAAHRPAPPEPGDQWWADYSRVEWRMEVVDGGYEKALDPSTGKPYPEDNWVWSPQGVINMHRPETWGLVEFVGVEAGVGTVSFTPPTDLAARRLLRQIYHVQRGRLEQGLDCNADLEVLGIAPVELGAYAWPPQLEATSRSFRASLTHRDGHQLTIVEDGRITRGAVPGGS